MDTFPHVVVTGGLGALGGAVCKKLVQGRYAVTVVDRVRDTAGDHAAAGPMHLETADLADSASASACAARILARSGRVDALVNIAGGFAWETIASGSAATWDWMYESNVRSCLNACREFLPTLLHSPRPRIVNIGSSAAARAGAGMGAYAAAKSSVLRLTEALAEEQKLSQLTVNAILPSIIDTPANRREMPDADFGRWVAPEAIAAVVMFLLSDAARAIHGAGIPVTGRV
ncbi:MAG TPA: SDR family NAD(P)-dependent oxidoreductase [Usitatibacteraceae bacterium]|nr:SDR family NAD(P)-dependent oxidoreductase [Usitatibacteraceae bacterium]